LNNVLHLMPTLSIFCVIVDFADEIVVYFFILRKCFIHLFEMNTINPKNNTMQNINWNFLINTIKEEKSILFIGPELVYFPDGRTLQKALCEHLDLNNNKNIKRYYDKDEFFFFDNNVAKMMTCYEIKDFYNERVPHELYYLISQLPFSVIVSVSPDLYLRNIFTANQTEHQFAYYSKTEEHEIKPPSKDNPLIYNLFGSIDKAESLILTYDDLFEFIFSVLGSKGLPDALRTAIRKADSFIFLGFSFDKWYMQLLLKLLDPEKNKYQFALGKEIMPASKVFFADHFKIDFVESLSEGFIQMLFDKCNEKGLLRQSNKSELTLYEQVIQLVQTDEVEKALNKLLDTVKGKDESLENDIVMLLSRHNRLQRKISKGVIDEKEADLENNKIKDALLEMNKDVKDLC